MKLKEQRTRSRQDTTSTSSSLSDLLTFWEKQMGRATTNTNLQRSRSRQQTLDIPSAREDYTWMAELNQRRVRSPKLAPSARKFFRTDGLVRQICCYFPGGWAGCSTC